MVEPPVSNHPKCKDLVVAYGGLKTMENHLTFRPKKWWSQGGGGGGRDEVWDRETMFSQLAKRTPMVFSGKLQYFTHSKYFYTF